VFAVLDATAGEGDGVWVCAGFERQETVKKMITTALTT
jgi:hypothetical protein